jgi:hypothetical protein
MFHPEGDFSTVEALKNAVWSGWLVRLGSNRGISLVFETDGSPRLHERPLSSQNTRFLISRSHSGPDSSSLWRCLDGCIHLQPGKTIFAASLPLQWPSCQTSTTLMRARPIVIFVRVSVSLSTDTGDNVLVGNVGNCGNCRNYSLSSESLVTRSNTGYYRRSVGFIDTCK